MKYINEIFDLLLDKTIYSKYGINKKAKYWKMGTSFITMFDRLREKLENVDISYPMISVVNYENKTTQGNNPSYQFKINNINVTPCKVRGYVSENAMGQYMRAITSFGLGVVETSYSNFKDFVQNNGEIKLIHNIHLLLKPDNRINLIKKIIIDAFFSNIQDTRDICYSIIIEFLLSKNFDFQPLKPQNRIFQWKKIIGKLNNKEIKFANLVEDKNKIKNDIYKQGTIATYKEIIECLNNEYPNVEDFINDIWLEYQLKANNKTDNHNIKMQIDIYNKLSLIESEYAKFKNNIFIDRKNKGLIKTKHDLYSDIVDINNSTEDLLAKFNESNAAHIYAAHKIKNNVLKNCEYDKELIKWVSNPNNGLMMKQEYHSSFDRHQWYFDANGYMIVPVENQNYLFKVLKLKKVKINPIIFNNDMKYFLIKR